MGFIATLFNFSAFALVVAAGAVSFAVHRGVPDKKERLLAMGGFAQSLAFTVSLVFFAWALYSVTAAGLSNWGPQIGRVIMTALYGALVNLGCGLYVRFGCSAA
ncbi:MAG: hypothetical protein ABII00_18755 [Elusimicrobiota bacterium]